MFDTTMYDIEQPKTALPKPFNVLSLDGGGVRGTIEAVLLDRLQKANPKFVRDLDLIVGTSTGGIQALALAAGRQPEAVRSLYEEAAKKIFEDSFLDDFRDLWKITGADYSNKNLRKLLQLQFGDMRLGELSKRVAIVAFDLDNEEKDINKRTWKAKIFHNCDGDGADLQARVVDVALYTSAAPTFFPTVDGFIDGGVVANNPSMIGLAQALDSRNLYKNLHEISLLSLGTGKVNRYVKGNSHDWGIARWAPYLFYILFEGSTDIVHFQCQQILGKHYHRLDPALEANMSLDDWKKISKLVSIAEKIDLKDTLTWMEQYWL